MLQSVKGIYRNGHIELLEPVSDQSESEVIVTFLPRRSVVLAEHGIDERQAADLRHRLTTFAEDWDRPEMSVYDDT